MTSLRPLLVGELNPYGSAPEYALYPYPRGAAGHRLASLIMGLGDVAYLRAFDRANLCEGRWSARAAREASARLAERAEERPAIVLLGRKVCDAFGVPFEPFSVLSSVPGYGAWRTRVVVLPHPSGRNRVWNEPGAALRARATLRWAGVLPVPAEEVRPQ